LLDNKFVFADFWRAQNGSLPEEEFRRAFRGQSGCACGGGQAGHGDGAVVVLSRIYVLRNQLMHGGATWGSSVNREQMRDCTNFMAKLVPLVIEVMMDHPQTLWGPGCWPVVKA
jgi:hypothetical protein